MDKLNFKLFLELLVIFFLFYLMYTSTKNFSKENFSNEVVRSDKFKDKKVLVLFVFHQYNERVKHFIENCIFYDKNVDFLIICNNPKTEFSHPKYVSVIRRENLGYDFAGWSEGLLIGNRYKKYDYFLFVNSSVMGPFLDANDKRNYVDIYLEPLNKNDVKLFGSTINTQCNPEVSSHVQSYIFSVDREALEHLIYTEIFSLTNSSKTFQDAITNKEIKMSRDIIDNNWNIGCLHRYYKDIDFRYINKLNQKDFNYVKKYGDIMVKKYQNYLWKNKELVFVKGNRLQLDNI